MSYYYWDKTKFKYSLDIDDFWDIVKSIDWGSQQIGNHGEIKKSLMKKMPKIEFVEIFHTYSNLYEALKIRIEYFNYKYDMEIPYNDSNRAWDNLAHIIGLGKDSYASVMQNPLIADVRLKQNSFIENFSYCISIHSVDEEYLEITKNFLPIYNVEAIDENR